MTDEQKATLKESIKNYLDITYSDKATEEKLTGIIDRGMSYLQRVAGASLDFVAEGEARGLLFDYCRYARSNALENFETNYKGQIIALRLDVEVTAYESSQADTV